MTLLPQFLLRHTAIIKPFQGEGAYGPMFGAPYPWKCLADDERRLVRDANGSEVVSDLTLYGLPGSNIPAGSEVQVNGQTTTVIAVHLRSGGGLPTPDHVEVVCQ